ncbi:hypothetical protein [Streptomyces sp. NPDC006134]|uniref:hypothetical protein n=1 Tax=Streptomyces sp. NPDC006134 TaxID=3154467 RepID=UPI0033D622A3
MAWQTEEFGASHEGIVGAVLADGSEPKPVYLDTGSGGEGHQTSEWWAYTGRWGRPKAAGHRAACACGWRGQTYPIDWDQLEPGDGRLDDLDVADAYDDWADHIDTVSRQTVPLPDDLTETLTRLRKQLARLTDQAPVAALRAVGELERLARAVGHEAACATEADELSPKPSARASASARTLSARCCSATSCTARTTHGTSFTEPSRRVLLRFPERVRQRALACTR